MESLRGSRLKRGCRVERLEREWSLGEAQDSREGVDVRGGRKREGDGREKAANAQYT